jgi:photosystem II stability/assembly factor-like uncharacterized protein
MSNALLPQALLRMGVGVCLLCFFLLVSWVGVAVAGAGVDAEHPVPWQAANQGLTPHAPVTTVVADPTNTNTLYAGVYAGAGFFVSFDRGRTWQQGARGVDGHAVFALHFDPQQPRLLWAGTADGLYRGVRGATLTDWTWTRVPGWPPAAAVYSLYSDAAGRLYAAGEQPGVWMQDAQGAWQPLPALEDEPRAILSVAATPRGLLLAGTDGGGLFVSRNRGQTWQPVPEIGATFVAALWVAPWNPDLLLARTRAGLFRSADGAATWQQTAANQEARIDALAGDPATRSIYLGLSSGALLRSTDDGLTWQPWGDGVGRDGLFHTLAPAPGSPDGSFYAGTQHGFYRSDDAGRTWQPGAGLGAYAATALAAAPDGTLYLGNSDGVYISTDAGARWRPSGPGLPPRTVLALAVSPHDPRVLYAATEGDGIYRSTDGGGVWTPYAWDDHIIAGVLPDPERPQRIYARVAYERVYVSDDDGVTWTSRWDSMPPTTEILSLAVSPHAAAVLFAGAAAELYRSDDRALDWQRIAPELAGQSIFHVAVDPTARATVYAGATNGLYRSRDGGATWQRWGQGLEDVTVTALALAPAWLPAAFAGARDRGVYASFDAGATWQPIGPFPASQAAPAVRALHFSPEGRWLYAATNSGFYRLNLDTFARARPTSAALPASHRQELPKPPEAGGNAPRYGVHTLVADERTLPLAAELGADTVVQLFPWREIEPTQGQFLWQTADEAVAGAEYYGLNLIVRLDHPPEWALPARVTDGLPPVDLVAYSQYVRRVAARYAGRVAGYIIWNEPNLALEWSGLPPDPKAYVELLKVGYQAVKETDPAALVISAGLAPTNTQNEEALDDRLYLAAMYAHGAAAYFDLLGVHAYGFGHPHDDPRGAHAGLNLARTADLRDIMLRFDDEDKQVWITEMGWTVAGNAHSAWQEVTAEEQATYLTGALESIRRNWPWVELVTVWNLGGEESTEWGGYSLLAKNGRPRPAYTALQTYLAASGHGRLAATAPSASAPRRYQVLAPDAVIHLGDNRLPAPWVPLHRDRNPSPVWRGIVYLQEPNQARGAEPALLTVRVMQSNFWSNRVWVNGRVLPAPLPVADFSKSWVSHTFTVPPGLLQPGPNEIRVTIAHAPPLIQDKGFGYDKLQFKDIVLSLPTAKP